MSSAWIFDPTTAKSRPDVRQVGGKAANLARLAGMGQPVPAFFAITVDAFRFALEAAGAGGPASLRLPEDLVRGIEQRMTSAAGKTFAVRSSAADEDAAGQSFAGIHESYLHVAPEGVAAAVLKVWASAFAERAIAYRKERGLPLDRMAMAVVVQEMIDSAVSGVLFTANPVSGDPHEVVVSCVYGLGEGLVSEGLDADTFTVGKADLAIASRTIPDKAERMERAPGGGTRRAPVAEAQRRVASLTDAQVVELARAGMTIESACGRPQDIEFAYDAAGRLYILQTRPVTTAGEYGPAAGHHLIWDNSNITESYSGVTSPMTFSFIRRAYTIVYHCFAEVMGIPPPVVKSSAPVFENMLGLIRGQVYYNLLNWYRLIRLFPGFGFNKGFMESMMGVKEPAELKDEYVEPSRARKLLVEMPRLVRLLARTAWNFGTIRRRVAAFDANFHRHYDRWSRLRLDELKPHELMALYREMEDALLWNWRTPIISDFYVMIYYGVLKKLCTGWCGDANGSLQNDLICGEGGIESTEPTRLLLEMAAMAQRDPVLRELILNEPAASLPARIAADPRLAAFSGEMARYLDLYGFRCMNELKLEEPSLRDRPAFVYTILRNYLALDRAEAIDPATAAAHEGRIRAEAEQRAFGALKGRRGALRKRLVFRRVLRNARLGVKNRENMRFARTRIYGLLRDVLRALGRRFAEEGILGQADDIFYLTLDECWDFVKGTAVTTRLQELSDLRRREFDAYRAETDKHPDDRFETYGMVHNRNLFRNRAAKDAAASAVGALRGTGCCPGVVTGVVKVLRTPTDDLRLAGEILVADRTDPGWVPLYPSISGLLVERGSILSHSAIVAREMGIPTIVGIPGLTARIQSGMKVRMDGAAGTVEIVEE